jgi:hypothetical protein
MESVYSNSNPEVSASGRCMRMSFGDAPMATGEMILPA